LIIMKALALILTILANAVAAQSSLQPCDTSLAVSAWTNCQGTYTYANGTKYVGEWRDGKPHGQGTGTSANLKYVGEHRDGKLHGQGTFYSLADNQFKGDKYVGEFRDNKRHGQGIYTFADGSPPQEGLWEDHKFVRAQRIPDHIAGRTSPASPALVQAAPPPTQTAPPVAQAARQAEPPRSTLSLSTSAYGQSALPPCAPNVPIASWTNCQGTYTFAPGDKYVGEFRLGKFHGQGTYTFANGDRYVGEFRDRWSHGQGIYTFADGRPLREGIWEKDKFVRAERIPDHIAGRSPSTPPPVLQTPRQAELSRSPMSLTIASSQPDANGVITLSITTNGDTASLKVNGDEEGSSANGRYSVRRFAQIGETQFEVIATDRFGNTKKQKVSVFRDAVASTVKFPPLNPSNVRARPATNAVAIIIGIQDYRRVPKAEFANNDARLFYDYAVRGLGVKPENIKLLLDQEADDVGILGAIQNWLPLKARKGQTDVYVFYSGHGLPSDDGASLYLLPHGVDRQFLDRTAIKQSELVSALQAANPKSVTLFMDACYSGQIRTGETLLASARPIVIAPRASSFPSNFTVLTASAPDQLASSSPDLKHGVFSYYLMKGMEGEADQNKDGSITVQEMQSYLKDSVGRKAMALNRTQQPQVVGDQSRVLVGR
jgi:hypothetical protein